MEAWEGLGGSAACEVLVPVWCGPRLGEMNSMGTSWQNVESLLCDMVGQLPPRPLNINDE